MLKSSFNNVTKPIENSMVKEAVIEKNKDCKKLDSKLYTPWQDNIYFLTMHLI